MLQSGVEGSWEGISVFSITLPDKESGAAKVLAEGKGNIESILEEDKEGSYKYQLWPHDQLQKQGLCCSQHFFLMIDVSPKNFASSFGKWDSVF